MQQRSRINESVTPQYEDAGLFAGEVCEVTVELVPIISRNDRGDVIITGFVKGDKEITVNFAGRRAAAAKPLVTHLEKFHDHRRMAEQLKTLPVKATMSLRLKVFVEGAWRAKFRKDADGWQRRSYQLMASRWAIMTDDGATLEFGEPPII